MFNVIRGDAPESLTRKVSYSDEDVVLALCNIFHNKCYICETKEPTSLNVEHFDAHMNDQDKKFDWNNLFFSCARCNNFKRQYYNNLINCTDPTVDALRLIRHSAPLTPFTKEILIEAQDNDPKTIETADLIKRIFTEDNTGNKGVTGAYLRRRVWKRFSILHEQMNRYINDDLLPEEREDALSRIKHFMNKQQEYSAFLRWAILDSPELLEILAPHID